MEVAGTVWVRRAVSSIAEPWSGTTFQNNDHGPRRTRSFTYAQEPTANDISRASRALVCCIPTLGSLPLILTKSLPGRWCLIAPMKQLRHSDLPKVTQLVGRSGGIETVCLTAKPMPFLVHFMMYHYSLLKKKTYWIMPEPFLRGEMKHDHRLNG